MAQQTTQTGKNLGARNWLTHHTRNNGKYSSNVPSASPIIRMS